MGMELVNGVSLKKYVKKFKIKEAEMRQNSKYDEDNNSSLIKVEKAGDGLPENAVKEIV